MMARHTFTAEEVLPLYNLFHDLWNNLNNGAEIDALYLEELFLEHGLTIQETYVPTKHGENEFEDVEIGDLINVLSEDTKHLEEKFGAYIDRIDR